MTPTGSWAATLGIRKCGGGVGHGGDFKSFLLHDHGSEWKLSVAASVLCLPACQSWTHTKW